MRVGQENKIIKGVTAIKVSAIFQLQHGRNPRGVRGLQPPHFEVGVANAFQPPEFKDISEILLCS
jgi:hypothetical protein